MNATHRRPPYSFTALSFVIAAFTLVSIGQATTAVNIVWPPFCEDVECNDVISPLSTPYPGTFPTDAIGYRTQSLIPSSVFDSLGPGPFEIIAFAWRPDQSVYEPVTVVWEEATWNLSTTPIVGLSLRFANNYGPGGIEQVFSEPVTYYTDGVPRGFGLPHEFDYRFEFETPYLYDPREGNLLAEYTTAMAFDETHYIWADFHRNNASQLTVFGSLEDVEQGFRIPGELVLQLTVTIPLPGDYNDDGTVNAADYTVWRDALGSVQSLPNDDTPGVGVDDYDRWRANFGMAVSASSPTTNGEVPEPSTLFLCCLAIGIVVVERFGRPKS